MPACRARYDARMTRRRLSRRVRIVSASALLLALVATCAPSLQARITQPPAVRIETLRVDEVARTRSATSMRALPIRAQLVGASWRGAASGFELRTRIRGGAWSTWTHVEAGGDGPDPGTREARARRGRHLLATPIWVDAADEVQLRAPHDARDARVRDVRLEAINTTGTATPTSRLSTRLQARAAHLLGRSVPDAAALALAPRITPRTTWAATSPGAQPQLAERTAGVVVHHTVSTNAYACSAVPAMLRGIQRYHMRSNGWNDIGYNFLIDRCGGVWEGRSGGVTRAVVGAHASGFNTGTVGIALIGTHGSLRPTAKARAALQRLIAWRLDVAHVLPSGTTKLTARSSDKFRIGQVVTVRAVSGHRDLFPTSCPGWAQYSQLKADALRARAIGGLKVANITTAPVIDPVSGVLRSVTVRAISTDPRANLRIALERTSTGQVLAETASSGGVTKLVAAQVPGDVPAWDVRVRANAATATQRARGYLQPLGAYPADPGFTITQPPPPLVTLDPLGAETIFQVGYGVAAGAVVGAWLHDPVTGVLVTQLDTAPAATVAADGSTVLDVAVPATIMPGAYELRVGVAADTAPGRSIRRFAFTVSPAA